MNIVALMLGLIGALSTPSLTFAQVVRSADCEMIDRHIALLRQGVPRQCMSADTAFDRAVMRRLDGRGSCRVGDLSDPGLDGFRCWITSGSETATLSCLRPLASDEIDAARTDWANATPEYVQNLRSAALCPTSNGRSGYAALTLQGPILDEFVKPEFGFVTGIGTERRSLERIVQTFGTGDPLLPWEGGTPIGVETYALTACLDGAACDPDAMEALGITLEGWSAEKLFSAEIPAQQGVVGITSAVEVTYREVDALEPGETVGDGCLGDFYGESCPFPDEGNAFIDSLNAALSREGFVDIRSIATPDEFESFLRDLSPQMQGVLDRNVQEMASPYAWRHNKPEPGSHEMAEIFADSMRSGRWRVYLRELTSCPLGGAAFIYVFSDAEDDGQISDFTSFVTSMWMSSCDAGLTTQADDYLQSLIIQTAEDQKP